MKKVSKEKTAGISFFEKYLTVWVLLCMAAGILIGKFLPGISHGLEAMQVGGQNIPMAILMWVMIYPMMLKIDFKSVKNVVKNPKGVAISTLASWGIKPFLMFGLSTLFFQYIFKALIPASLATDFVTGAILLGAAPCTAMVFVWSTLTKGNPAQTLVQVSFNDLLILILFIPIVQLLLGVNNVVLPLHVLVQSIVLFVVIPLVLGVLSRIFITRKKGLDYFNTKFVTKFDGVTTIGLLLTLIIIFTFQGDIIVKNPLYVVLIAVPLILQNVISFSLTYSASRLAKLPSDIAAPASLIAASDFFELSVAVAITLFGVNSPVVLACTVGVLTEVPVMLLLVKFINAMKHWFKKPIGEKEIG